jgi:hypothetical protein
MPPASSPRARAGLLVLALGCLATPGCTGWSCIPRPAPAALETRQELQIWTGHASITLRHVVVDADSVSGVRADRYPRCDSCRVAIPQAEIDSFRLRPADSNNNFGAGMIVGLATGPYFAWAVLLTALHGT